MPDGEQEENKDLTNDVQMAEGSVLASPSCSLNSDFYWREFCVKLVEEITKKPMLAKDFMDLLEKYELSISLNLDN